MHDFLEWMMLFFEFTQISQSVGCLDYIECVVIFHDCCGVFTTIGCFLYSNTIYIWDRVSVGGHW